jgi:ABC-type sugar transport system ATPase subunit
MNTDETRAANLQSPGGGALDHVILSVRDVSKAFGSVQALNQVTFDITRGEVTALLGDNGAGKSTLVKILSGAYRPDEGQLLLNNNPVELRQPADAIRHGIATVFQDLALVDTLDVGRNIFLGITPTRFAFFVDYPKLYRSSRELLRTLKINMPSVRAPVSLLSGGQRQAVALARALAKDAELFLMDEPTAALGVSQTAVVNQLILDLRAAGKSVVVISHNLQEVMRVADRVVVLRHGECVGVRKAAGTTNDEIVALITGARGSWFV